MGLFFFSWCNILKFYGFPHMDFVLCHLKLLYEHIPILKYDAQKYSKEGKTIHIHSVVSSIHRRGISISLIPILVHILISVIIAFRVFVVLSITCGKLLKKCEQTTCLFYMYNFPSALNFTKEIFVFKWYLLFIFS